MSQLNDELLNRYLNVVDNYLTNMHLSLHGVNRIFQLYLDSVNNIDTRRYNLNLNRRNRITPLRRRGRNVRSFNMSPLPTQARETPVFNFGTSTNTDRSSYSTIFNPFSNNIRSTNTSNNINTNNNINRTNTVNRDGLTSNRMRNILNATLNSVYNSPTPASAESIRLNTSEYIFSEISSLTTQESCPISLTTFDSSSVVLKINECGHIFMKDSLLEWFNENTRCPVCRYNIDPTRNIFSRSNSTQTSNDSNNSPSIGIFDISFTIPNFLPLSSNDISNNNMNEIVDNVSNILTEGINDILSNNDYIRDLSNNSFYLNL